MHHFFVKPSQIGEGRALITGPDVNHIKNVLRVRPGEELLLSDGAGTDYLCRVEALEENQVRLQVREERAAGGELPAQIWLFQGLPKSDKMELIVQKAVELGAAVIVPVLTRNTVVKLDEKKAASRVKRWQAIAESAAKQSKRSALPQVKEICRLSEALRLTEQEDFGLRLIPYENAEGMGGMREALAQVRPGIRIAVFIGPEGGFDPEEIQEALAHGTRPVSLGSRILRTETAGLAVLSVLMMRLEGGI